MFLLKRLDTGKVINNEIVQLRILLANKLRSLKENKLTKFNINEEFILRILQRYRIVSGSLCSALMANNSNTI